MQGLKACTARARKWWLVAGGWWLVAGVWGLVSGGSNSGLQGSRSRDAVRPVLYHPPATTHQPL